LVVTAAALLAALAGQAAEQKVPLEKLPKAVTAAVKKRFPKAEMVRAEKESEKGKTLYEVGISDKGKKIEVTVTPMGVITEIEKQIVAGELPKTVTGALSAKYPTATYKKIEEVIKVKDGKERLAYYEVLVVTAARKRWRSRSRRLERSRRKRPKPGPRIESGPRPAARIAEGYGLTT
jgi:hypothetical protein